MFKLYFKQVTNNWNCFQSDLVEEIVNKNYN